MLNFSTILTLIILLSGCLRAQQGNDDSVRFYINGKELILINDSTVDNTENYKQFVIEKESKTNIVFNEIPTNIINTMDEYGRQFSFKDSLSEFEFLRIDTLQDISDISLSFDMNKVFLDSISFRYQILSKTKRVSDSSFGKINVSEVGYLFKKECVGLDSPVIVFYGFLFYQKGVMYSVGGGYFCVIIK